MQLPRMSVPQSRIRAARPREQLRAVAEPKQLSRRTGDAAFLRTSGGPYREGFRPKRSFPRDSTGEAVRSRDRSGIPKNDAASLALMNSNSMGPQEFP